MTTTNGHLALALGLLMTVHPSLAASSPPDHFERISKQLSIIQAALEAFAVDWNRYPGSGNGINGYEHLDATDPIPVSELQRVLDPYLSECISSKDPWGHPLLYWYGTSGQAYAILCLGPKGVAPGSIYIPETPELLTPEKLPYCPGEPFLLLYTGICRWPSSRLSDCSR